MSCCGNNQSLDYGTLSSSRIILSSNDSPPAPEAES